jgi:hypothetical protein
MSNIKILTAFVVILSLVMVGFGIYLTVVSNEDPTKHKNIPKWVTNHLKALKIAGPSMIGAGVLCLAFVGWSASNGSAYQASSNFGFRFY